MFLYIFFGWPVRDPLHTQPRRSPKTLYPWGPPGRVLKLPKPPLINAVISDQGHPIGLGMLEAVRDHSCTNN